MTFSGFIPLAALATSAFWFPSLVGSQWFFVPSSAVVGLLGVFCSAMIYADTHRDFWSASECLAKFFGTTLLLGSALVFAVTSLQQQASPSAFMATAILVGLLTSMKLAFEHRIFRHLVDNETRSPTPLNKTASLLANELGLYNRIRIFCGAIGGTIMPALIVISHYAGYERGALFAFTAFAMCLTGEIIERYLFFTAVAPAKMPGALAV
jgi:DMSO reductase anchor subunit